jgi:hypothetical protein
MGAVRHRRSKAKVAEPHCRDAEADAVAGGVTVVAGEVAIAPP